MQREAWIMNRESRIMKHESWGRNQESLLVMHEASQGAWNMNHAAWFARHESWITTYVAWIMKRGLGILNLVVKCVHHEAWVMNRAAWIMNHEVCIWIIRQVLWITLRVSRITKHALRILTVPCSTQHETWGMTNESRFMVNEPQIMKFPRKGCIAKRESWIACCVVWIRQKNHESCSMKHEPCVMEREVRNMSHEPCGMKHELYSVKREAWILKNDRESWSQNYAVGVLYFDAWRINYDSWSLIHGSCGANLSPSGSYHKTNMQLAADTTYYMKHASWIISEPCSMKHEAWGMTRESRFMNHESRNLYMRRESWSMSRRSRSMNRESCSIWIMIPAALTINDEAWRTHNEVFAMKRQSFLCCMQHESYVINFET